MKVGEFAAEDEKRMIETPPDNTEPTDAFYEWLAGKRSFSKLVAKYPLAAYIWDAVKKADNLPIHLTWIFTALLAAFAYKAWVDSKETTSMLSDQAKALRGQIEEMQEEQRPWLFPEKVDVIPDIKFGLTRDRENVYATYATILIKNTGRRPAYNVYIEGVLHYFGTDIIRANSRSIGDCSKMAAGVAPGIGPVVFPGQEAVMSQEFFLDKSSRKRWGEPLVRSPADGEVYLKELYISGCVYYRIDAKTLRGHSTSFFYRLRRKNGDSILLPESLPSEDIDLIDVILEPNPGAEAHAD